MSPFQRDFEKSQDRLKKLEQSLSLRHSLARLEDKNSAKVRNSHEEAFSSQKSTDIAGSLVSYRDYKLKSNFLSSSVATSPSKQTD